MKEYYFIGTLLPSLSFEDPPEISFDELDALLRDNLTSKDYEKTLVIRRFYDILNLRALWLGEKFDPRGRLTTLEMDEALASHIGLPSYVYEFVDHYSKIEERVYHFPLLLAKFFQSAQRLKDPFLRRYFSFERELRLVMTAFRAKRLGRNLGAELQYEDPEEELIAQMLAQQDANNYVPPGRYQDLKVLFDKYGNDPLALQKALDMYRFETVDTFVDMADTFSIERILVYFVQFILVQTWFELDQEKGTQIVDRIIKAIK